MRNDLLKIVKAQFKLDLNGDHGLSHWIQTEKIGLYLAKETKADTEVLELFALLHDSKRINEGKDPEHGAKAAKFVQELYNNKLLSVTVDQLTQLVVACRDHANRNVASSDITVQVCLDSDRLNLFRLGILPDTAYLFTDIAKQKESLQFASKISIST